MIEPTNICNLKCPLCPSGAGLLKRERGYMSLSLFKSIIDEIEKHTFMLLLWNQGEPFLNPDFLEMVKYAHSKKLFMMTSTNANILPDPKEIVRSGLDMILISFDGATQETYNKYRMNGDLAKVLNNVRELVKAKKEIEDTSYKLQDTSNPPPPPPINVGGITSPTSTEASSGTTLGGQSRRGRSRLQIINQFLVMKHNEHEIEEIKRLTKEIGFDDLALKTVQIYSKEDIDNFLPENPKYRRYKLSGEDFELKFGIKNRCQRIWTQPVINWNGEVSVCCFDKDIEYKIGNVSKNNFFDLWKSERMMLYRQIILKNRKLFEICRNCGEGVSLKIRN